MLRCALAVASIAAGLWAVPAPPAQAACTITNSPCYPWRIESEESDAVILRIVPNNAITSAIYRICTCTGGASVEIAFDFGERSVTLDELVGQPAGPVCRDYRIQTTRRAQLTLRRADGQAASTIEGCYTAATSGF